MNLPARLLRIPCCHYWSCAHLSLNCVSIISLSNSTGVNQFAETLLVAVKQSFWHESDFRFSGWQPTTWEVLMCGLLTWMTLVATSVQPAHIHSSTTSGCQWVNIVSISLFQGMWQQSSCQLARTLFFFLLKLFIDKAIYMCNSSGFPPKPTTTPAPTTTRDPIASFCHGRPDGLYTNPIDRTTYFQCFMGNTYKHHCQPGLIYWDSCKCCNWPWSESVWEKVCNAKSTSWTKQ